MSLSLSPEEREALDKAWNVANRINEYCRDEMEDWHSYDALDVLADAHAASACLLFEIPELAAIIDGEIETEGVANGRRRILIEAISIVEQVEQRNSDLAQRLRAFMERITKE